MSCRSCSSAASAAGSTLLVGGNVPAYRLPDSAVIRSNSGVHKSVAKLSSLPWMTWQIRSSPMPVSTCWAGSSVSLPVASRLYWMKTLFQISITRGSSPLTGARRPAARSASISACGLRSTLISVHGPHGPVSPISQKLSLAPKKWTWSSGRPATSFQMAAASVSRGMPAAAFPS